MSLLPHGTEIVQNAYVVNDLEKSCQQFNNMFGAGPFMVINELKVDDAIYRGKVTPLTISIALCQVGGLNIELIQQHSDGHSCYRDIYPKGQQGFHHTAIFARDYVEEKTCFVEAGFPVAMEFNLGADTSICYVDTRPALGHMLEIYQDTPAIRGLYALVKEAAENWDGKELIQLLEL